MGNAHRGLRPPFRAIFKLFPVRMLLGTFAMVGIIALFRFSTRPAQAEVNFYPTYPDYPGTVSPIGEVAPWTDSHCNSCHQKESVLSHPIDVVPSMVVGSSLPLENGKMTCVTCHLDDASAHSNAKISHNPMLRESVNTRFCEQCHTDSRSKHGANILRAHLERSSLNKSTASGFDAETANCVSCHDGLISSDTFIQPMGMANPLDDDHPVGVVYGDHQGEMALKPPEQLNPRIRLFEKRVGCGSCHSPYSKEKQLLVMSNDMSALCMSCHQP